MSVTLKNEDVTDLSAALENDATAITDLMHQEEPLCTQLSKNGHENIARSLRNAVRLSRRTATIFKAVAFVLNAQLDIGGTILLNNISATKLDSMASMAHESLDSYKSKLSQAVEDILTKLHSDDNIEKETIINLAKSIKTQTEKIEKTSELLAHSLCDNVRTCPLADGELGLLTFLYYRADEETIAIIDKAFELGGGVMVPLSEAPILQQSIKTGDEETIKKIVDRLSERL